MDQDAQRRAENFAIMVPLKDVDDADVLAFIGTLIQDHDHLREKLETEPDRRKRADKLEAMRPHLRFKADTATAYEMASAAKQCGFQPYYQEAERIEQSRIHMPPSFVREVQQ